VRGVVAARQDAPVARRRALLLHQAANLLSGVSNSLVMIVIPWLILDRTGSAAAAGVAGALTGLPGIAVAPVVGAMVDRLGRKSISVGADVLSALSVALFPLMDAAGRLSLGAIFALTLLGATFDPAGYTARKALIPDVAAASGAGIDHVNGLHEGLFAAGWVIGPALGAFAIATVGPVGAMWWACGAFLLAAAAVLALAVPNRATTRTGSGSAPDQRFWATSLDGLRALVADRPVWILTLAVAVVSLIYMPTESVLLPVHFQSRDEPGGFGAVLSALAAGSMVGAFGYGWIAARVSRYRIATVFMTLACVAYLPLAALPATWVLVLSGLVLGLAWGPMEPLLNSVVQARFPPEQHGRVYGVQLALFYAAPPLGELLAGVAVEGLGVQPVIVAIAAALVLTALVVDLQPTLRGLDTP
jgi:MFS family permease